MARHSSIADPDKLWPRLREPCNGLDRQIYPLRDKKCAQPYNKLFSRPALVVEQRRIDSQIADCGVAAIGAQDALAAVLGIYQNRITRMCFGPFAAGLNANPLKLKMVGNKRAWAASQ